MPLPPEIKYMPILAVRPSEMAALHELPEKDKDLLLPAIQLRPWLSAIEFEKAVDRVTDAFGSERIWIANLDETYSGPKNGGSRIAVEDFRKLQLPENGYENWCAFVERHRNLIPTVQMGDTSQFRGQVEKLASLGRGVVLHLKDGSSVDDQQFDYIASVCNPADVIVIADCGELMRQMEYNIKIAEWSVLLDKASQRLPNCRIVFSSTSFPYDFSNGLIKQEIRERQLFNIAAVSAQNRPVGVPPWRLIYSDRGSVRMGRNGGGGVPYPRIDYPTNNTWFFFRSDRQDGDYQPVAKATRNSPYWNKELKLWGMQMIERTADGDETAITSPTRATAVRINIHLHQQLFYSQPDDLLATDDVWVD